MYSIWKKSMWSLKHASQPDYTGNLDEGVELALHLTILKRMKRIGRIPRFSTCVCLQTELVIDRIRFPQAACRGSLSDWGFRARTMLWRVLISTSSDLSRYGMDRRPDWPDANCPMVSAHGLDKWLLDAMFIIPLQSGRRRTIAISN